MTDRTSPYDFVFRGLLTEEALDRAGRPPVGYPEGFDPAVADKLSLSLIGDQYVQPAEAMAPVYVAVAAFENAARNLVTTVMRDAYGDDWWENEVSERIRKRAATRQEDEERHRFHTQRGTAPINYTELKDLLNIIRAHEEKFEPFVPSSEWTAAVFNAIEMSRNVIMHSGTLDPEDIDRVGMNIRDWITQVGT